jgi:iron(III) transport system substrate-binding protein
MGSPFLKAEKVVLFFSKLSFCFLLLFFLFSLNACKWGDDENTIWIYTSLYKDTISDLEPQLAADFPGITFKFYQAGSEEVAGKVYAESIAGRIQADILIASDRFWYEDMARQGKFLKYAPQGSEKVDSAFRRTDGAYSTVSYPVMIISYNNEKIKKEDVPQTFKELAEPQWAKKVSSGSPLASGTTFTTVAFLVEKYGWDYFKDLRKNDFIAEGGNSGVVRRIQNNERPIGIVLLENILRLTKKDPRIQFLIPKDGAVMQANVLAIVNKERKTETVKKVADWLFGPKGQNAMVKSYMYAGMPGYPAPEGAPPLPELLKSSMPWTDEILNKVLEKREFIKEEFSRIVF